MVIFRANFHRGKRTQLSTPNIFRKLNKSLLHPWQQLRVRVKQFPRPTKLSLQNVSTKLTLALFNQLHITVKSVKNIGATSVHLC